MAQVIDNKWFKDGTDAIVTVKHMSPTQQTRMLMDLVWKAYHRPKGLTMRQLVIQSYNTSILIP